MNTEKENKRQSNIEALRIISICMIISYHYVVHSGFSFASMDKVSKIFLDFFSYWGKAGVNIFCIIMGYFGINAVFSIKKLIKIETQVLFYSYLGLIVGLVVDTPMNVKNVVTSVFPTIMGHYWFVTAYMVTYLFSPILNRLIKSVSQRVLLKFVFLLLIVWGGVPFFSLQASSGMFFTQLNWFLVMYIIGAYLKIYRPLFGEKSYEKVVIGCVFVQIFLIFFLNVLGSKYPILSTHVAYFRWSNCPIVVLFSIAIFRLFEFMDLGVKEAINFISVGVLGIYLFHENIFLQPLLWDKIFRGPFVYDEYGIMLLVLNAVTALLVVFIIGFLVDVLWQNLSSKMDKVFERISLVFDSLIKMIIDNILEKYKT